MQARSLIQADFARTLPVAMMFNGATVDSIADHLTGAAATGTGPMPGTTAPVEGTIERPATRDVVRLIRTEQRGVPSVAHHIGLAVRLGADTDEQRLTEVFAGLAGAHAALRTGIVPDDDGGFLLRVPAETGAGWSAGPGYRREPIPGNGWRRCSNRRSTWPHPALAVRDAALSRR
ncbi:hypothetical protein NKG94_02415 [Micromonospora sp. M12]